MASNQSPANGRYRWKRLCDDIPTKGTMDFDDLLEVVGPLGLYQKYLMLVAFVGMAFCGIQAFAQVFVAAEPPHRCWIDACDNRSTSFHEPWMNNSAPWILQNGINAISSCTMFVRNGSSDSCWTDFSSSTKRCTRWKFDKSVYESTISTQWNLVCGNEVLNTVAGSMYMTGIIIGSFIYGYIADRFGRRVAILTSAVPMSITGIAAAFFNNYVVYNILRVVCGAAAQGVYQTLYVLVVEFVGKSKRSWFCFVLNSSFPVGEIILGLTAYYVRKWNYLQLAVSLPSIIIIFYYWILPESVRWLLANQEIAETKSVINKIAKWNKSKLPNPTEMLNYSPEYSENDSESNENLNLMKPDQTSIWDLFKTSRLRWRTINIMFLWFANVISYYGISLSATRLGGDDHLNFLLTALAEIPSYFFCLLVLDRIGRRKPLASCLIVGGLACICVLFVPKKEDFHYVSVTLTLMGKFGCSAAFAISYLYSTELFPTVVRNKGIGISSMVGHIGAVLAPFVAMLGNYGKAIPYLVIGGITLVSGVLTLFLPETLGKPMPQTIDDASKLGKSPTPQSSHTNEGFTEAY